MIFLMGKKAIIYIIFASWILISCKTPRLLHYASEISDSTFIYLYLQNSALPSDDKETTGRNFAKYGLTIQSKVISPSSDLGWISRFCPLPIKNKV